jgi:hypothetical protein
MKDKNPLATDARNAERLRKFGPGPHRCLFCDLADPLLLYRKTFRWVTDRVPRSVLELHHVLGRNHDPDCIVSLCVLCHFSVSQGYLQAGIELRHEPNPQKRVEHMLRAEATFLRQLADRNCRWAAILTNERVIPMLKRQAALFRQLADDNCQWASDLDACKVYETCDGT